MNYSNFPKSEDLRTFLQNIKPMEIEHIFLDKGLWHNNGIRVNLSYAYSDFDNENYLILSLYDATSRKILKETICPAGLDDFTGKIMTCEASGFVTGLKYGNTKAYLKAKKDGKVSLLALNGTERKEVPIRGLEAYTEDF